MRRRRSGRRSGTLDARRGGRGFRLPSLLGAVLLAAAGLAQTAFACSCAAPAPEAAFARASAVFVGTVTAIERPLLDRLGLTNSGLWDVSFAVVKRWKGWSAAIAVVRTRVTSESCGFAFAEGQTYLVYVIDDAVPRTGICTGTKPIAEAAADLAALDALVARSPD